MFEDEDSCCELDENYCDECGHFHPEFAPDGRDLYDSFMERTVVPPPDEHAALALQNTFLQQSIKNLDNQVFMALDTLEYHVSNRLDKLQRDIDLANEVIVNHLYPEKEQEDWDNLIAGHYPDDFDTQRQVEELPHLFERKIEEMMTELAVEDKQQVKKDSYYESIMALGNSGFHSNPCMKPIFIEDEPQEEGYSECFDCTDQNNCEDCSCVDEDEPVNATIYSISGEKTMKLKFPTLEAALKWTEET